MNPRHLRFFVALAQERHYGRAAAACHVTQPTLSEAIRALERELEAPLINRQGNRYRGLTLVGELVLMWAERILAHVDALTREFSRRSNGLFGVLRLGVIPAATSILPLLTLPFRQRHPEATLKILSCTSVQIQRALDARDLDAGVTYTDNEPLANVQIYPLYREHYVLLTPRGLHPEGTAEVTWRNAAKLPLCLLTRDMQNRRIVDRLFVEGGAEAPAVAVETDSLLCLAAHIRSGTWSSILPHTFAPVLGHNDAAPGFLAIPLVEPRATRTIGLVVSGRTPLASVARAFLDVAREANIAATVQSCEPASPA